MENSSEYPKVITTKAGVFVINRVKCDCTCHTTGGIMHFGPCCNDGWIEERVFNPNSEKCVIIPDIGPPIDHFSVPDMPKLFVTTIKK